MSTVQDAYRPPSSAVAAPVSTGLYAGFWRRVAAYLLDSLILLIPGLVLGLIPILGFFLQLAMWATYKAVFEAGERQATPGKRAMGIKVTTLDGERISKGQAVGRYFGMLLSGIILGIGFMMAGFTARRQGLHDMMASTLVVSAEATDEDVRQGAGTMAMTAGVWVAVAVLLVFPFVGGILAAIAVPAYQDYTVRAKMAEVVNEAYLARDAAGEEIRSTRAGKPVAAHEVGSGSNYVHRVLVDPAQASIRAEIEAKNVKSFYVKDGAAVVLTLSRDGSRWDCAGAGVPNKLLPAACRK
jgi:uncharacterized RDD family membrane protein YckC/Tfp pilus assembly major pilin PilA